MKLFIWRFFAILLILVWLPVSIPLIMVGCFARAAFASLLYGYTVTDEFLYFVVKKNMRDKP